MKSASDYGAYIRSLLINLVREGLLQRQTLPLQIEIQPDNQRGNLFTWEPGLLYSDGAVLRIEEAFHVDAGGHVHRERYTYHYERSDGYYFRFEREQHDGDLIYKPEYHLHVLWRLPHFPAPPVTLEDALNVIQTNFYGPHRQRLVGYTIDVEI